jgi:hypothetical protein
MFLSRLIVTYISIWKEAVVKVLKQCIGIYLQKLKNTMKTPVTLRRVESGTSRTQFWRIEKLNYPVTFNYFKTV